MIVHDTFVFLQMRKTACTFIGEILQEEFVSARSHKAKHVEWAKAPAETAGLPVLTYVRNPWDWYVSWYHFNRSMDEPTQYWQQLSAGGTLDFPATIRNATRVPTPGLGSDFYTAIFRHLIGDSLDSTQLTVGRYEELAADLEAFLAAVGLELSDGGKEKLHTAPPVNESHHRPYRDYYDDDLRDVVGASSKWIADRFGYEF